MNVRQLRACKQATKRLDLARRQTIRYGPYMHAGRRGATADVEFLVERFNERTEALGLTTDADKARFLDMEHGWYWRVSRGQVGIGGSFISKVLTAPWPEPVAFDDFFLARKADES